MLTNQKELALNVILELEVTKKSPKLDALCKNFLSTLWLLDGTGNVQKLVLGVFLYWSMIMDKEARNSKMECSERFASAFSQHKARAM